MRKPVLIVGSILCLFILVSFSYQPIVADIQIEQINQVKKSKAFIIKIDMLTELYKKLVELKSKSSNNDCGCSANYNRNFTLICNFLTILMYINIEIQYYLEMSHISCFLYITYRILIPIAILLTIFHCFDYSQFNLDVI